MLDSYEMSYTEVATNTDVLSKEQVEAIKKGNVLDWMYDSRALCENIYAHTEIGEKLSYNYLYEYEHHALSASKRRYPFGQTSK